VTEKRLFDYDIIEIIASVVFYTHLSPKRVAETISEGHLGLLFSSARSVTYRALF